MCLSVRLWLCWTAWCLELAQALDRAATLVMGFEDFQDCLYAPLSLFQYLWQQEWSLCILDVTYWEYKDEPDISYHFWLSVWHWMGQC